MEDQQRCHKVCLQRISTENKKENGTIVLSNPKNRASLPKITPMKILMTEKKDLVILQEKIMTEKLLFLLHYFCWIFQANPISNPPMLHFVNWEENNIFVYVNDSDILRGPIANHINPPRMMVTWKFKYWWSSITW